MTQKWLGLRAHSNLGRTMVHLEGHGPTAVDADFTNLEIAQNSAHELQSLLSAQAIAWAYIKSGASRMRLLRVPNDKLLWEVWQLQEQLLDSKRDVETVLVHSKSFGLLHNCKGENIFMKTLIQLYKLAIVLQSITIPTGVVPEHVKLWQRSISPSLFTPNDACMSFVSPIAAFGILSTAPCH